MPWKHVPDRLHPCTLPNARQSYQMGYPIGSVWECDICTQEWKLIEQQFDGVFFSRLLPHVLIKQPVPTEPKTKIK